MTHLPAPSITTRLNALAAAAIVTTAILSGIDSQAVARGAGPQLAQAAVAQAA
jgi:hypothetical protein